MYKKTKPSKTTLTGVKCYNGESIEKKVNRIVNNKEPIKDGAPLIYTPREKGVDPAYNIRTDRFEVAVDKMDYVTRSQIAKRTARGDIGKQAKENMDTEKRTETNNDGKPDTTQTTN